MRETGGKEVGLRKSKTFGNKLKPFKSFIISYSIIGRHDVCTVQRREGMIVLGLKQVPTFRESIF